MGENMGEMCEKWRTNINRILNQSFYSQRNLLFKGKFNDKKETRMKCNFQGKITESTLLNELPLGMQGNFSFLFIFG